MSKPENLKLEELLKLKRTEVPSKREWDEFEEGLRRKMALRVVDSEPLWVRVFSHAPQGAWKYVPVAGAAMLVAAFFFSPFSGSYDTSSASEISSVSVSGGGESLPNISASFAGNALSGAALSENPVAARMSTGGASVVSYVSGKPHAGSMLSTY